MSVTPSAYPRTAMGITCVRTAYGPDSARALRDAVAEAKGGEPLAPVTVVVPSNHVGVATRRLLSSGSLGPVAGAGRGAGGGHASSPPTGWPSCSAPPPSPGRAGGRCPRRCWPPPCGPSWPPTPGCSRRWPSTPPPSRPSSPPTGSCATSPRPPSTPSPAASDRAAEVVRLHRAARARLEPRWSDEEDLLAAAAALAGSPAAAALGALVVHLPQRLSPAQRPAARRAGRARPHHRDRRRSRACRRPTPRSPTRCAVSGSTPTAPSRSAIPRRSSTDRTVVLTASDADEEVRAAVRAVVDAVRAGTRLDRIAVLHASPEPYARLAHEQLHAAGIATNGAAVVPLAARVAGRTLLDLLALPAGGYRRQDVFAWLSSAPILHAGRLAPTTGWERLSPRGLGGRRRRLGPPPHPARAPQPTPAPPRPSSTTRSPSGSPNGCGPTPNGRGSCARSCSA